MPLVHNPYGPPDRLIIEAPCATCFLCGVPWADDDTLVVVAVHEHTPAAPGHIPSLDVTFEFAHEDCAQKFGYELRAHRTWYEMTFEDCCAKQLAGA